MNEVFQFHLSRNIIYWTKVRIDKLSLGVFQSTYFSIFIAYTVSLGGIGSLSNFRTLSFLIEKIFYQLVFAPACMPLIVQLVTQKQKLS